MRKFVATLSLIVLTLAFAGMAMAGSVPTPTDPPEGVTILTTDQVKPLVESNKVQVFDMRKALNFGKGHVPGATSTPYKWTKKGHPSERTGKFDMTKLPSDKNTAIVFHSDGPNGWKSYYASKAAVEAGYKNVSWMRQGFASWQDKGYPVEQ
jgi:rhodanese-related sulfurtransferase